MSRYNTLSICVGRCGCLRRSMQMSAPVDADVCAGRCGCLRRSMRMSASVDADVCVGRCGWFVEAIRTEAHRSRPRNDKCLHLNYII